VIDIGITQVDLPIAAAFLRIHRREVIRFCQALNIAQPRITADWTGTFTDQLHAVVVHRVMAGRHFNTAIYAQWKVAK
jgi:hypothetical protein